MIGKRGSRRVTGSLQRLDGQRIVSEIVRKEKGSGESGALIE